MYPRLHSEFQQKSLDDTGWEKLFTRQEFVTEKYFGCFRLLFSQAIKILKFQPTTKSYIKRTAVL